MVNAWMSDAQKAALIRQQAQREAAAAQAAQQAAANVAATGAAAVAQTTATAQQGQAAAAASTGQVGGSGVGRGGGVVRDPRVPVRSSPILHGFPEPFEHWSREQLQDEEDHYTQYKYQNAGDDSDQLNTNLYG